MSHFKQVRKIIADWFSRHWKASAITSMVALAVLAAVETAIQFAPKMYGCIIAMVTGNGSYC